MNKIAFEMWIIFCQRDLHGSFIKCIKIGHKLPIVLCFQDDKKSSTSNNDQTTEFCRSFLLQWDFFMLKSAWEYYQILYSIYIVYFLSYKICLVQPPTFQRNFFQQDVFWNYIRKKSYMWWTYQINSHSYMNKSIGNLKYWDNAILTEVFVKWDKIC